MKGKWIPKWMMYDVFTKQGLTGGGGGVNLGEHSVAILAGKKQAGIDLVILRQAYQYLS